MSKVDSPPIPVFGNADATRVVLLGPGLQLTAGDVATRAQRLAMRLPEHTRVAIACQDRGVFLIALLACWLRGNTVFLPAAHGLDAGAGVTASDATMLLADEPVADAAVAAMRVDNVCAAPNTAQHTASLDAFALPADFPALVLQTSGSTGAPVSHTKTWQQLVLAADAMAELLTPPAPPAQLLAAGTVSHRHMFGFEILILQALRKGTCIWSPRLNYPADVPLFTKAAAANAMPRWLVTTPHHLRVLRDGGLPAEGIDRVISATMPLDTELALSIEHTCNTAVSEIYGSTETGCIATRRTAHETVWHTGPRTQVSADADGRAHIRAPHIGTQTLTDQVRIVERGFELVGRDNDLVKVAGKRASLQVLTQTLKSVPGVRDACLFDATRHGATRLAAFVVAPGATAADIRHALAQHIDLAFMPRPLLFVDQLPRDANGKIAQAQLRRLWNEHLSSTGKQ